MKKYAVKNEPKSMTSDAMKSSIPSTLAVTRELWCATGGPWCSAAACAAAKLPLDFLELVRPGAVQQRVPRAGDAVLVRVADDLRDLVEVEHRRRRAHLPLERQRAPRIARRRRAVAPRVDHVVEEDDHRRAQSERADRDEHVPVRELRRVVGDAARHPLRPDEV